MWKAALQSLSLFGRPNQSRHATIKTPNGAIMRGPRHFWLAQTVRFEKKKREKNAD